MSFVSSVPFENESVWAIMSRYMDQTKPLFSLIDIIMRSGASNLSHEERELLAAYTSSVNNCAYCHGTHQSTAEAFGVDEGLLESISEDIDSSPVADKLKPLLHYVWKLTLTPSEMVQADVDRILSAGWDENDLHYVVMICAMFNFFNRLIDGYGVKNIMDYRLNHGKELAEHGYSLPT